MCDRATEMPLCQKLDMNSSSNRNQPRRRRNRRQRWGFEYGFRMNGKSEIDVEIRFGKAVVALGLMKALDETNLIVYRGFWANAKKCEVFCPKDMFNGVPLSPLYIPDSGPISPDLNGNHMLKFRGRTIRVKVKVDSLDLLLIENLLKVDSKTKEYKINTFMIISVELK